jgi:hypothetical protein
MAHRQLGHTAQSQSYLRQATAWVEQNAPLEPLLPAASAPLQPWTLRLDIRLLYNEAKTLIGTTQPPPPKELLDSKPSPGTKSNEPSKPPK